MVPIRGCSLGSTTSVREVPSAPGLPGQSAAEAGSAHVPATRMPNSSAAACLAAWIFNAVPIRTNTLLTAAENYDAGHECGLNRFSPPGSNPGWLEPGPASCRERPGSHGPRGNDC